MGDIEKKFDSLQIDYVQYQFTTIFGDLKTVEFPVKIWDSMKEGTGVDGSSLGFLQTEQSDMKIVPDYNTFAVLPWDDRVARFICDVYDTKGNPHPTDPRGLLKAVLQKAKNLGYEYKTRPELEWTFVDTDSQYADEGEYMDTFPHDIFAPLRRTIVDDMLEMNIPVKTIHHECGKGQQEIELIMNNALTQADNVQTSKLIIKTEALLEGVIATFMPKPHLDQAGNGLHIHQYLTHNGENVFSDPEKGISDLLRWFVGGILEHVDEITAVLNPTTNSYKRLTPGHEAPVYKSWGVANRTALIRVPGYEKKARIEFRATDGATNIYLASALLLGAGLKGIERKIEPIEPTTANVEKLSEAQRKELGITKLPKSLDEALDYFESSSFVKEILTPEIVDIFVEIKSKELKEYQQVAKDEKSAIEWERKKYLLRA
ncbi:MAG: glutamine synthetase family protein [Candidatus Heimdallarchaeaceae archaeon]